jgi:ATP-dependent Clp protease ATP-binding subunit ClpC
MSARRYPIALWQHQGGLWSARLLSVDADITGAAATRGQAVADLAARCLAAAKAGEWSAEEPLSGAAQVEMAFHLHPAVQARRRWWPLRDGVRIVLPVVTCDEPPFRIAFVPTIGLAARMLAEDSAKAAVTARVLSWFADEPPEFVGCYLPPRTFVLDSLSLSPEPPRADAAARSLAPLDQVADALGTGEHRAWQRDAEVAELAARLGKQSVAIVGEAGCGKTAILRAAARLEHRQRQGGSVREPRIWLTSGQRLIAGMRWLGEWQERCEAVIHRLASIDGTLCVEALVDLLQVGGMEASGSVAAFLTPYLQRRELRLVGECTAQELSAIRRLLPSFADCLTVLAVPPMARAQAVAVVVQSTELAAKRHGVEIDGAVAREVEALFRHHLGDLGFPGPAARFIDRMAHDAAVGGTARIDRAEAIAAFSRHSGLASWLLRDEEPLDPVALEARVGARLVGQAEAVSAAVEIILAIKAGLCDPARPLASLLLAGPTGVGKTRLAQLLAEELFPQAQAGQSLVRVDLSEYAGGDAAARLLGFGRQPSELVRSLRQQPAAVVLLDEVEKADPVVFDLLLGALDEGRLHDHLGRPTSLRQAVVVMTSNLGAEARPLRGFGGADEQAGAGAAIHSALAEHFRPEFLARLDRVVVFHRLGRASMAAICNLELEDLARRHGMRARGLSLRWDETLVEALVDRGFDPELGARPLQRAVQDLVAARLARLLVAGRVADGAVIRLGWDGQAVTIDGAAP